MRQKSEGQKSDGKTSKSQESKSQESKSQQGKRPSSKSTKSDRQNSDSNEGALAAGGDMVGTREVAVDMVAQLRAWPVVPASAVPTVNAAYQPLTDAIKRPLVHVWSTQRAEVIAALQQVAASASKLQADLGPFAPEPGAAERLLERYVATDATATEIERVVAYVLDQSVVAQHDAMTFLMGVQREIEHMAEKRPVVATRYPAVMAVKQQRVDAMIQGKAQRSADKAAAGGSDAPTESDKPAATK